MKKNVVMGCLALIAATTLLTGCFGASETPSESSTESSQQESGSSMNNSDNSESDSVFNEEESAYREWSDLETNQPAFDKNGASVDADELLRRAVMVETFLQDYPESTYREEAVEYYNRLVTAAITGGYISEEQNNHLYLDEEGKSIRSDVLDTYNTFLEENAGTKTANIVEEYVTLLGNEQGGFTDSVKSFYTDIVERMKNMFDGNENSGNGNNDGGNNTDNAGETTSDFPSSRNR